MVTHKIISMEHPFLCFKCGVVVDRNKANALEEGDIQINFCNPCFSTIEEKDYEEWILKIEMLVQGISKGVFRK